MLDPCWVIGRYLDSRSMEKYLGMINVQLGTVVSLHGGEGSDQDLVLGLHGHGGNLPLKLGT